MDRNNGIVAGDASSREIGDSGGGGGDALVWMRGCDVGLKLGMRVRYLISGTEAVVADIARPVYDDHDV